MNSKEKLQLASMTAGIISLILIIFEFAVPVAALGIIFAVMSSDGKSIEGRGQTGLIISIIGLVFGLIITISSFYLVLSGTYDKILKQLESTYSDDSSNDSYSIKDWLEENGYTTTNSQTEAA